MRITRLTDDPSVSTEPWTGPAAARRAEPETQPESLSAAGPGPDTAHAGHSVPRLLLGERLRRLREAQYLTLEEAAETIRLPIARLGLMEVGRTSFRPRDVSDLLTAYDVHDDADRSTALSLAEQANAPGWWAPFRDVTPGWLHSYLGLEQAAGLIRSYEVQFVPGLLQTPEYARAVIVLGHGDASDRQLRRRAELRARRQRILRRPRPPHLWAVIDEAALRRPIGGPQVMRDQLEHLIAVSELPHITLQVLPFAAGGHSAAGGPVALLRMPQQGLPDRVYLEQLLDGHYPEDPEDIRYYRQVIDRLVTTAEPPARTGELLRGICEQGWG
ncbi:DUF5753 domain-containing protein [Streptomyces sp. N2-109]|uniref:DUF5753 domain-containing protein n=1 Tax=Streptomyces gossypii TaxID=2883101 RepID=A0ABT2JP14_9ACTN|nr:DUF5753 domain-containing protein [Streptomyces gossypii]MCT2589620.1 DUF5753 domain-containing protein [Streptomyces gossypii]